MMEKSEIQGKGPAVTVHCGKQAQRKETCPDVHSQLEIAPDDDAALFKALELKYLGFNLKYPKTARFLSGTHWL